MFAGSGRFASDLSRVQVELSSVLGVVAFKRAELFRRRIAGRRAFARPDRSSPNSVHLIAATGYPDWRQGP
eukprot:295194-Lingulodinium_polyedra.AAC.1